MKFFTLNFLLSILCLNKEYWICLRSAAKINSSFFFWIGLIHRTGLIKKKNDLSLQVFVDILDSFGWFLVRSAKILKQLVQVIRNFSEIQAIPEHIAKR